MDIETKDTNNANTSNNAIIKYTNVTYENNEIRESLETHEVCHSAVIDLLESIATERDKVSHKFFILSAAYDKIFKKYNLISLTILILSAIVTLIEAIRLTIIDLIKNKNYDVDIDVDTGRVIGLF